MYKQFKIFYGNIYGKIGFIILLGFVIITLLTPLIVIEPNYSALAPTVDTSSPTLEFSSHIMKQSNSSLSASSLYFFPSTDTSDVGAQQLLFSSTNGSLYSLCIDAPNISSNNKLYNIYYPRSGKEVELAENPTMSTLENCQYLARGVLKLTNFIFLPFCNGNIIVGKDTATKYSPIHPLFEKLYNISYKGNIASGIITNSLPYTTYLYNNPSYNYEGIGAASQGELYFLNTSGNNYMLNDFSIYPEYNVWHVITPLMGQVGISFMGSGFSVSQYGAHSEALVYNKTSIYAYSSITGKSLWNISAGLDLNVSIGLKIPSGQEESYSGANYGFYVNSSDSLEDINLINGSQRVIYTSNETINTLSTSPSHGSFPSSIILSNSKEFIILHENAAGKTSATIAPIPVDAGKITNSGTYGGASNMIYISESGYIISVNTSATSIPNAYLWSLKLTPISNSFSAPNYILNGRTGTFQIGVVSGSDYVYLVSAIPVDNNPISPTLTSPTGQAFPLGTEYKGYNVWSQFIGAFEVDWEFGIIIGLYTMGLAVIVAMYVGYKGGISGGIIETISLGIYLTPSLGLLIALTDFFPANQRFTDIILVIGGLGWPFAAFTLMGIVKSVKNRTYIEASKMLGSGTFTILRKDILPNLGPLMLYMLSLSIAGGAGAVSSLQFLGIARISLPTWGGMLSEVLDNFSYTVSAPFWIYPPVIALTMFVFSFIFISRGMDELSNPRLRRRQ